MNFKLRILNVRNFGVNNCHPEALEGRLYSYAFLIANCALILFLVHCDLKVKTENTALFRLISQFVTIAGKPMETVAMPTLNPAAGTYDTAQTIALSTPTSGATIYYTLDGSMPTTASTQYTTGISITVGGATTTIQALAVKGGMADSGVASGTYVMNFISPPVFNPVAGTYGSDQSVIIDTPTFGATIYYTLDGLNPTPSSAQYTTPISIAGNRTTKTIKAIAIKSGLGNSPIVNGTWTIDTILPVLSINSVSPSATLDGASNQQIKWQATQAGTYSVKIGSTNCIDGTLATGTNVSGNNLANTAITTTVNNASLSSGANTIRFCVLNGLGNYGYITQNILKDDTVPIPGNSGIITITNVVSTSMTLNWTKATDTYTAQTSLQYKVVRSLSNNIDSVVNAEANGTLVQDWTTDINTVNVTGIVANTYYYFNVMVKDGVGYNAAYALKGQYSTIFSIGGTITGLTANGLVLQNNGSDNLSKSLSSTTFTFATLINGGSQYSVTILTQPTGLGCTVSNGNGTANLNVVNIAINCWTSTPVTYAWGTFTDNFNGTIRFNGIAGTYTESTYPNGSVTFPEQTLTWMKCSQGFSWNATTNNCDGTWGSYQFCDTNDYSCIDTNTWLLNGTGYSSAYITCDTLVFAGISNWRVPALNELRSLIQCNDNLLSGHSCGTGNYTPPTISNLFPKTSNGVYANYISTAAAPSGPSTGTAYNVGFYSGNYGVGNNDNYLYVRCVSGP
ncbi:MAG: chitobiase/beta-hexosaminidase C-terminal domain-containing protein [Leptospiraceae bacterium]|nr:chitobiase/beta-hexosaminidase C-terminal domain-containing protein [Leptospiraceae bacterium]